MDDISVDEGSISISSFGCNLVVFKENNLFEDITLLRLMLGDKTLVLGKAIIEA